MGNHECETDLVFKLGWLIDDESARGGIRVLQQWVRENRGHCSEADTIPGVEAVLRGLGWDTLRGDVAREGDCKLGDLHLYDVCVDRKICVLIEVKRLHSGDKEFGCALLCKGREQLSEYLERLVSTWGEGEVRCETWTETVRLRRSDSTVFAYGVLTTGQKWWVYDATRGFDLNQNEPILRFDLCAGVSEPGPGPTHNDLTKLRETLGKGVMGQRVARWRGAAASAAQAK